MCRWTNILFLSIWNTPLSLGYRIPPGCIGSQQLQYFAIDLVCTLTGPEPLSWNVDSEFPEIHLAFESHTATPCVLSWCRCGWHVGCIGRPFHQRRDSVARTHPTPPSLSLMIHLHIDVSPALFISGQIDSQCSLGLRLITHLQFIDDLQFVMISSL